MERGGTHSTVLSQVLALHPDAEPTPLMTFTGLYAVDTAEFVKNKLELRLAARRGTAHQTRPSHDPRR